MALGLSWHSAGRIEKSPAPVRIAAVLLALWYTLPHFGEVAVWMCGSTVYLWTMTIMVWFLLPYHFSLRPTRTLADSYLAAGAMFLLGILAGWGEENASLATIVAATAVTLYSWHKGQRYRWQIAGVVGSVIGFIALVIVLSAKLISICTGDLRPLVTNSPYFYVSLTAMILGTQMFLAGFIGELISRDSPNRNKYKIETEL